MCCNLAVLCDMMIAPLLSLQLKSKFFTKRKKEKRKRKSQSREMRNIHLLLLSWLSPINHWFHHQAVNRRPNTLLLLLLSGTFESFLDNKSHDAAPLGF